MNLYDPVRGKARRKELGLSAARLANLCGVSATAIYKYESGELRPSFLTSVRLAHHLRVSIAELVEQVVQDPADDNDGRAVLIKAIYAAEALRHETQGSGRILMAKADANAAEKDRAAFEARGL
ncbi:MULTISPECIES: helix-turn-helix domain-containing protein [Streptomyces]|uniref:helix-turn-helix domain-containing protein n=1 Tax=Streptomyces TaxID=1883 RepID=UPI00163C8834|nr:MULTISPECIES: helix-turn-helix transcriptional regulator [Streptomyces]MBC2873972.1 helix-turn-helix transcriptional regulator [Streptomyces sp. TYQ1024]UBI39087.1 helix-turn-helix domain-containing protein [Streptomyces mobaraensis]UKW31665.1 helix-turn-helix domain-containing protein [Streptomyces sp. TYQ1024]